MPSRRLVAPHVPQPPPHSPDHRGRGDVVGLKCHPQLVPGAHGWRFLLWALLMFSISYGAQPPLVMVPALPAAKRGQGQHLLCHWDLPGTAENLQTSNPQPRLHRNIELPSLPPFHPCVTWPCTTKAFLHRISDNRQSCEMSE